MAPKEFVGARFVGGVAIGMASTLSPLYIAEISPAAHRGLLVSLNQLAIVTGILLSYSVNYLLTGAGRRCVRGTEEPQATGEDGLVVMKALCAGYASAGEGRKIQMPFSARGVQKPIDLWFRGPQYRRHQTQE